MLLFGWLSALAITGFDLVGLPGSLAGALHIVAGS